MAADVLGILGFALSVFLSGLFVFEYFRKLRMRVAALDVCYHGQYRSFVALCISFVNPSSQGKTIYHLGYKMSLNCPVVASDLFCQPDDKDRNMCVWVDEVTNKKGSMPLAEYLQCPLDILPHQSQSKWHPLLLMWGKVYQGRGDYQDIENAPFGIELAASDCDGKVIAKCEVLLNIRQLSYSSFYQIPP